MPDYIMPSSTDSTLLLINAFTHTRDERKAMVKLLREIRELPEIDASSA